MHSANQSFTMVNEGEPNGNRRGGSRALPPRARLSLPEVVMLSEGVNDLNMGGTSAIPGVIASLRTMIRTARQRGATVFVSTILPERQGACRAYDYLDGVEDISATTVHIRTLASVEGAVLVDLHPLFVAQLTTWLGLDGLHPNETGYAATPDRACCLHGGLRLRNEPACDGQDKQQCPAHGRPSLADATPRDHAQATATLLRISVLLRFQWGGNWSRAVRQ
jgi:hypothetical protein